MSSAFTGNALLAYARKVLFLPKAAIKLRIAGTKGITKAVDVFYSNHSLLNLKTEP